MDEVTLSVTEFEFDLGPQEVGTATPASSYFVAARTARKWLAKATAWNKESPIAVLDLAAGFGDFSASVCAHATTQDKQAVWIDTDIDLMSEGKADVDGAYSVELMVGDVTNASDISLLGDRVFDRITVGLLHHYIEDHAYRHLLDQMASAHLAPNGNLLVVELCTGMDPSKTREKVLPSLMASLPANVVFTAGTPVLLVVPVCNRAVKRTWSFEFLCVAIENIGR